MGEYEFPLVIFTVFSQWAVGIIMALVLLEWLNPKFMNTIGKQLLNKTVYIALVISVIGAISSMFHLNNPFKSYLSLLGTGHSWLSREIIAVILFNLCLLVFTYIWWKRVEQDKIRKAVGTLTALLGLVLVLASATVYFSMQLHPAWNNWTTFANFLLTGFLLGALTVSYFSLKANTKENEGNVMKILGMYLVFIIAALLVTISSSVMIANGVVENQVAATNSITSILFWVRVLGSLMVPATLVIYMIVGKKVVPIKYVLVVTGFVLIGELSGRMIFYSSIMSQYPWF
ncbi:dimethyl sulfoxide reductase anchor subunit [Robertmurraya sp. DFI.2.37]|nr:DmsC/YnfH family molybdoenzyme membrane anchor subunit [Robertmurraya sp. DFI.2.37]MDF1510345.1 dimethyl sulfoxide reductase anchor subunit [Robertmurraya sp. DFI.2.37]